MYIICRLTFPHLTNLLDIVVFHWEPGWPDWTNFRPMDDILLRAYIGTYFRITFTYKYNHICILLWADLSKSLKWPQNVWPLLPKFGLCISFDTKLVGLHLERFCHKLIWSPWLVPREQKNVYIAWRNKCCVAHELTVLLATKMFAFGFARGLTKWRQESGWLDKSFWKNRPKCCPNQFCLN
jgi:hypothetical protein